MTDITFIYKALPTRSVPLFLMISHTTAAAVALFLVTIVTQQSVVFGASFITADCTIDSLPEDLQSLSSQENLTVGDTVLLKCKNETHTLIGQSQLTCADIDKWDQPFPTCQYIECSTIDMDIPQLDYLEYVISDMTKAVYHCRQNFILVGDGDRKCLDTGQWSGDTPQCIESCDRVVDPDHGSSQAECLYINCTVLFACDEGYDLAGPNMAQCTGNGTWDVHIPPNCTEILCPAPPVVENAEMTSSHEQRAVDSKYPYETKVTYTCSSEFKLDGDSELQCGREAIWHGTPPTCISNDSTAPNKTTCPTPPLFPNGIHHIAGTTLTYTCQHGYKLVGDAVRECQENGTWSGEHPICSIPSTIAPNLTPWKDVFTKYPEWEGHYVYKDKPFKFRFSVLDVNQRTNGTVSASLVDVDDSAKLMLKGRSMENSQTVLFKKSRLLQPTERFTPISDWSFTAIFKGQDKNIKFVGQISSTKVGFTTISMAPILDNTGGAVKPLPQIDNHINTTALGLGIVIAVVSIIIAAALATYFMKQKSAKGSGHRSITSFENPVYDYEQTLK